jgi:hypothetical protein
MRAFKPIVDAVAAAPRSTQAIAVKSCTVSLVFSPDFRVAPTVT